MGQMDSGPAHVKGKDMLSSVRFVPISIGDVRKHMLISTTLLQKED